MKVDIFVHLYHANLLEEITNDIRNSGLEYRLFVNIPYADEALNKKVKELHPGAKVIHTQDKSGAIGGFLNLLDLWFQGDRSELLYFWHSKSVSSWRRELVGSLSSKVAEMFQQPKVGIVSAAKWHFTSYNPCAYDFPLHNFMIPLGLTKVIFGFVRGSIFMARSSIFEKAFKGKVSQILDKLVSYDLSAVFAFERIIGIIASEKHLMLGIDDAGEPFDEWYYMDANPDVRMAVGNRMFANGYDHYKQWGKADGRKPYDPETLYNKEPAAIVHRRYAMGDVILSEPIVRSLKNHGYKKVYIDSQFTSVFETHPDVSTGSLPLWADYFELDWSYNDSTKKLIQDAYLDTCSLTMAIEEKVPRIFLTAEEKAWAQTTLGEGKWVIIDPGHMIDRLRALIINWGSVQWGQIVEHVKKKGFKTLIIGKDHNRVAVPNIDLNMVGKTTERQLFALINHAHAIIGVDSGPLNIAQAVGTPGVGLYEQVHLPKFRLAWGSLITPIVVSNHQPLPVESIIKNFEWTVCPNLKKEDIEMTTRKGFTSTILKLVDDYKIQEILETGTFRGTGSTLIFAKTGLPVTTIECNYGFYQEACRNLAAYKNVKLLHGYSLLFDDMIRFIKTDTFNGTKPELIKDMPPQEARNFYLNEVSQGNLAENLLEKHFKKDIRQLVFLDSAGGMGLLECKKVLQLMETPVLLVMDDLNHVKHYRTAIRLKQLGLDLHFSETGSWGWVYIQEKPYI